MYDDYDARLQFHVITKARSHIDRIVLKELLREPIQQYIFIVSIRTHNKTTRWEIPTSRNREKKFEFNQNSRK